LIYNISRYRMSDYIGIRCKELRGWLSKNPGSYSKST
jgi:hypothetical protein